MEFSRRSTAKRRHLRNSLKLSLDSPTVLVEWQDCKAVSKENLYTYFTESSIQKIGAGGFGLVYLAEPTSLGRYELQLPEQVAIKELSNTLTKEEKVTLQNEMDILKALHLPHSIQYYACLFTQKAVYLVMELVVGTTLTNILFMSDEYPRKTLSQSVKIKIGHDIAQAINDLHLHNITHRDIKLDNVMIREQDNHVYLVDYGLACGLAINPDAVGCHQNVGTDGFRITIIPQNVQSLMSADWYSYGQLLAILFTDNYWGLYNVKNKQNIPLQKSEIVLYPDPVGTLLFYLSRLEEYQNVTFKHIDNAFKKARKNENKQRAQEQTLNVIS